MELGFIGFGNLGKAIISRLISKKHSLYLWNRTQDKYKDQDLEASVVRDPSVLVNSVDIIFICLFDSIAVNNAFTMSGGLLSANLKDKIIIDLSTNHYETVLDFHRYCEDKGGFYIEAPVLGSVSPALKGLLTVLISGDKQAYKKVKPYIEDIGQSLFYLKTPSLSSKMKLINNLVLGNFMATLAEALLLGENIGLSKDNVLDILSKGGGSSLVLNAKKDKLSKGDFSPHFSNALIYKDLNCLYSLAYELKMPLLTGAITKELYAKTLAKGIGDLDFSSIYKIFQED